VRNSPNVHKNQFRTAKGTLSLRVTSKTQTESCITKAGSQKNQLGECQLYLALSRERVWGVVWVADDTIRWTLQHAR